MVSERGFRRGCVCDKEEAVKGGQGERVSTLFYSSILLAKREVRGNQLEANGSIKLNFLLMEIPILPFNQSTVLIHWSLFAPVAAVHRSIQ